MIGEKIKELRTEHKLSQKELAAILNVSNKTISHWEANYTEPSLQMLVQIKRYFNVSYEELLEQS